MGGALTCCVGIVALYWLGWLLSPHRVLPLPDSAGYLLPPVSFLAGGEFAGVLGRSFGYPAFLVPLLALGGLSAVSFAQTLLVGGTALAAVVAWRTVHGAGKLLHAFMGAALTAALLSFQPLSNYASFILPEALYFFVATLTVAGAMTACFSNLMRPLFSTLFFITAFASSYNFYVKPHWGGAMIFTWIVLVAALLRRTDFTWLGKSALPLITAAGCFVCFALPQSRYSENDQMAVTFAPLTLFCNFADLIRPRLDQLTIGANPGAVDRLKREIDAVLEQGPGPHLWTLNGIDGDMCLYGESSKVVGELFPDPSRLRDFTLKAFFTGVLSDPIAYSTRVVRQILGAALDPFPNTRVAATGDRSAYAQMSAIELVKPYLLPEYVMIGEVARPLESASRPLLRAGYALLEAAGRLMLPVMAMGTLVFGRDIGTWRRRPAPQLRSALAFFVIVGFYLSSLMVVAVSHTFDIDRYREAAAPLALLALWATLYLLAERATEIWSARRKDEERISKVIHREPCARAGQIGGQQ